MRGLRGFVEMFGEPPTPENYDQYRFSVDHRLPDSDKIREQLGAGSWRRARGRGGRTVVIGAAARVLVRVTRLWR
ncbi:MAG: hypothetical protein ACYDHH_20130 [Solirubrobacteraceae bacterium]